MPLAAPFVGQFDRQRRQDRLDDPEDRPADRPRDQRDEGARDRDRVLYTSALRRLAGITQVVASSEGSIFHNRLTHTHEVAQIARRLAQFLRGPESNDERKALAEELGLDYGVIAQQNEIAREMNLDPEVAEAAALAHDLGHPPFGHAAEAILDAEISGKLDEGIAADKVVDGFEGNAQSFRVVTRLSIRRAPEPGSDDPPVGLNLTRATLDAILKYPWSRDVGATKALAGYRDVNPGKKWGAYESEAAPFAFARELHRSAGGDDGQRSAEAEIMDWADDVAYAVHDLDDFYRAGLVPLDRLIRGDRDQDVRDFWEGLDQRWGTGFHPEWDREELMQIFLDLIDFMTLDPLTRPFSGSDEQRGALRTVTARLIRRYLLEETIRLREPDAADTRLVVRPELGDKQLALLKELIWQYAILHPRLASQQAGKRTIIQSLFAAFRDAAENDLPLLPLATRRRLRREKDETAAEDLPRLYVRTATDLICAMTEQQAMAMHSRITGYSIGSVLDVIVQ